MRNGNKNMNSIPDEIWHFNILPYLHLPESCMMRCISKKFDKIIKGYLYNVKELEFDEQLASMLTEEGLGYIFVHLKMLHSIYIGLCWKSATENNLRLLCNRCPSLKTLVVDHCCNVTDSVLLNLSERCKNLEYLDISYCYNVSDLGIESLAKNLSNLKELIICSNYGISDNAVSFLSEKCAKLQRLDIAHNYLTDAALRKICERKHEIKEIRVYKCPNITQSLTAALVRNGIVVNTCF